MAKENQLSTKQLAVIRDLFAGQMDEQTVLDKHKVTRITYNKWLGEAEFVAEFERRIAALNRQTELVIAQFASLAAAKLVSLTNCEKEETARRACLDIINMPMLKAGQVQAENSRKEDDSQSPPISDETAGKLLATLAEANQPGPP